APRGRTLDKLTQRSVPLGYKATPEDIANGILWLASDESRYVTGTELVINGGRATRRPGGTEERRQQCAARKQTGGRHEPYLWCSLPERLRRAGYPRRHGSLGQCDGR